MKSSKTKRVCDGSDARPTGLVKRQDLRSYFPPVRFTFSIAIGALALTALATVAHAHGMSEADRQAMLGGGYVQYGFLGAKHMLTGYDHLLFLFGVMFFLTKFMDILKFITAFTLGHCITLIFATLLEIKANYFLIDAVIALTVCYKGFDNIDGFRKYLDTKPPNLLLLVFIFGLIHGFGLSARVQLLPLGEGAPLILRILSFNLGVEVGQVIALSVMMVLLANWRSLKSFTKFSATANTGLIAAGLLLFMMQMHGFSHQTDPETFGFPTDLHSHAHAEMHAESPAPPASGPQGLEAALGALNEGSSRGGGEIVVDTPLPPVNAEHDHPTVTEAGASAGPAAPAQETDHPQRPWSRSTAPQGN